MSGNTFTVHILLWAVWEYAPTWPWKTTLNTSRNQMLCRICTRVMCWPEEMKGLRVRGANPEAFSSNLTSGWEKVSSELAQAMQWAVYLTQVSALGLALRAADLKQMSCVCWWVSLRKRWVATRSLMSLSDIPTGVPWFVTDGEVVSCSPSSVWWAALSSFFSFISVLIFPFDLDEGC